MHSTLDKFGRVVIPKPVRDALHLTPGTALSVEGWNGEVVLRPRSEAPALKRKGGLLVFARQPTGDLLDAVERHRRERLRKASGLET